MHCLAKAFQCRIKPIDTSIFSACTIIRPDMHHRSLHARDYFIVVRYVLLCEQLIFHVKGEN